MSPAAIFSESSSATLWGALSDKLSRATWVFHPSWGLDALGARDIRAWFASMPAGPAMSGSAAWADRAARLALLRQGDLRHVAGLFSLVLRRTALRRCVDGRARRELGRMWSPRTIELLLDDPPAHTGEFALDGWDVERLCDEGAALLAELRFPRGRSAWVARAAFIRRLPLPASMAPVQPQAAGDFLLWCMQGLKDEPWWSG
jgi:hypothetical protein